MKNPHDIIIEPVITERSTAASAEGKYTFKVDPRATKTEIRQACEQLFSVRVLKVNTMHMEGKEKRVGAHLGRRASWKKAVVTIDMDPKSESFMNKGGKKTDASRKYKNSIEEFGFGQ